MKGFLLGFNIGGLDDQNGFRGGTLHWGSGGRVCAGLSDEGAIDDHGLSSAPRQGPGLQGAGGGGGFGFWGSLHFVASWGSGEG